MKYQNSGKMCFAVENIKAFTNTHTDNALEFCRYVSRNRRIDFSFIIKNQGNEDMCLKHSGEKLLWLVKDCAHRFCLSDVCLQFLTGFCRNFNTKINWGWDVSILRYVAKNKGDIFHKKSMRAYHGINCSFLLKLCVCKRKGQKWNFPN